MKHASRRLRTARAEPIVRALRSLLAAGLALLAGTMALAEAPSPAWPSKPVRLIVPFPAGTSPDVIARLLAERLTAQWAQTVVVDNKPGAGGIVGMAALVQSPADGYTLGFLGSAIATLTPHLFKNPKFNLDTQVVPVGAVAMSPMMIVVPQSSPITTLSELFSAAKSQPGKLNFASGQTNALPHLTGQMLARGAGTQFNDVPYGNTAMAVAALLSGDAAMTIEGLPALTPHVKAGKLRALAVTSPQRLPGFEDVPTAAETVRGFEAMGWFAIVAPAGSPAGVVEQVNRDLNQVLQQAALMARLTELGVYPKPGSTKAFDEFYQAQRIVWKTVVHDLGLQPQ